jgi:DNA-binding NtrC family response regulator
LPLPLVRRTEDYPLVREISDRVLVVDSEALIRWALCTALAAAGFDAVGAEDAAAAVRVAAEWPPPRVALVDWGPGHDTPRLVTEIRRIYPHFRFVLMTTADRRDLVAPGSWDAVVVDKPFDVARIVALVSEVAHGAGCPPVDLRRRA